VGWSVGFRLLEKQDLPLLHEWLQRPHVQRWWSEPGAYDATVKHYGPAIEGTDPTDLYLILVDEQPVGFIQTYLVADYPEWAAVTGCGEGVAGVDLLIGELALTGRGLGTEALGRFVADVVFARAGTVACIADPDAENAPSLRAFGRAGFRPVREFVDPEDQRTHVLVWRDRPS
jgi:RimJ/RimL family protein N-acetyltransferase